VVVQVLAAGAELPTQVAIPGTSELISTHSAIAFLGDRVFNCWTTVAAAPGSPTRSLADVAAAQLCKPLPPALAGVPTFAALLRWEAPARLSLQQALDLVDTCQYLLAEDICALLPVYLQPMLRYLPTSEVCAFLAVAQHCFS
jgi:hypothetical protein